MGFKSKKPQRMRASGSLFSFWHEPTRLRVITKPLELDTVNDMILAM